MQKQLTLGLYLKSGRTKKNLTALEVAHKVGIQNPLLVLSWERDQGYALQLNILAKLISLYELNDDVVLDLVLRYQMTRLDEKLKKLAKKV